MEGSIHNKQVCPRNMYMSHTKKIISYIIICSLRRVQILSAIECHEDNVWGLPPWRISFDNPLGIADSIANAIQALIH